MILTIICICINTCKHFFTKANAQLFQKKEKRRTRKAKWFIYINNLTVVDPSQSQVHYVSCKLERWSPALLALKNRMSKTPQFFLKVTTQQQPTNKLLPPSQIISHSKNLEESKFFKFDQIYIAK